MSEQLSLQGFDLTGVLNGDDPVLLRRKSDRDPRFQERLKPGVGVSPSFTDEGYNWPVKIFSLGRFALLHHGQPLDYGRKVSHRPIVFLKALIALGGRDISSSRIASALWPDADGDNAQRSFDTTLIHGSGGRRSARCWVMIGY